MFCEDFGRKMFRAFFVFVFVSICYAEIEDPNGVEKPFIDILTLDYFNTEQSLWSRLKQTGTKNDLYWLVKRGHLSFIANEFGVSPNTQNLLPIGHLANNVSLVNILLYNASLILQSDSTDSINNFDVHDMLANSIKYSEYVFKEAIRPEFWNKGKDVRIPRFRRNLIPNVN